MNWIRSAKSAYDNTAQIVNNVQQFRSTISSATTIFSSTPTEEKSENQQSEKVNLSLLEHLESDSKPFAIFVTKKGPTAKTPLPTIFHLVFVEYQLTVLKTADLQLIRLEQARLNKLIDLARESVENHLLDKFLAFSNKNQDWEDIHLACRLGLPAYVDSICTSGDALSIVNCATRNEGLFPIQLAAEGGFVQLVSKLISLGANINKCDLEGKNLLHHTVESSNPTAVEILKLLSAQKPQEFTLAMVKLNENGLNPVQLSSDKSCARHNSEILFGLDQLDPNCLDYLLQSDPELILSQKQHLLLHKPFNREILKPTNPLHTAAHRSDLSAAVQLLAHGAEVDASDKDGNTPLHTAVSAGALSVVKLLLCFGADIALRNKAGVGVDQKTTVEVVKIIKQALEWREQSKEFSQQAALEHQLKRRKEEGSPSCLLSLDGGGIRGLVLIQTLIELEDRLQCSSLLDHFNCLAGTSTGAILALALADGLKPKECLQLYLRLKDEVFNSTKRPYSAENIEHFLQQQFGVHRTMADLKRTDVKVMVTATRADINPPELILYRNYIPCSLNLLVNDQTHSASSKKVLDPKNVIIWKAARASSAAPTYFPSVDGSIMDGGLIANNPSVDLLADVQLCNAALLAESGQQPKQIACLVSLGTGKLPVIAMTDLDVSLPTNFDMNSLLGLVKNIKSIQNLKTILVEQVACSDGQVVERAEAWCHSLNAPFFRFTPQLQSEVPLDTTDDETLVRLLWTTKWVELQHLGDL
uniref:phospholipase A2 n=1 Tax=Ditylenchus dipsaci TaxID=166011 RepID=A0A915ELB1_9BILA